MDDPVEGLSPEERRRIRNAEAQARYRANHPDRIEKQRDEQYKKHRTKRLAEKKQSRYGPKREEFLKKARETNRRYRERHPKRVLAQRLNSYERHRVKTLLTLRAKRRMGNEKHFASLTPEFLARQQRSAISMNTKRGARVFAPLPVQEAPSASGNP
jgi:hypothetical protein